MDWFGARYMSWAQGRFTSPDRVIGTPLHIVNPQRWNRYVYGMDNPLSFTDPDGLDAIAVNFSKEVGFWIVQGGHEGIVEVDRASGQATYARFGPLGGPDSVGNGEGEVQTVELPPLTFRSDDLPTDASYRALTTQLASIEGQDASTVRLNYFKTSPADTLALKNWINGIYAASKARKAPRYDVAKQNCAVFTICGLIAGRAIKSDTKISLVPNTLFDLLSLPSDENYFNGDRTRPHATGTPDVQSTFTPCGPNNPYCPGQ